MSGLRSVNLLSNEYMMIYDDWLTVSLRVGDRECHSNGYYRNPAVGEIGHKHFIVMLMGTYQCSNTVGTGTLTVVIPQWW